MVKESAELIAVAMRYVDSVNRQDYETAANLFHRAEFGRYIGTDSDEWWSGFVDVYPQHMEEFPSFLVEVHDVEASKPGPSDGLRCGQSQPSGVKSGGGNVAHQARSRSPN